MEPINPYSSPTPMRAAADVEALELPDAISKPIRNGWVAAIFSGVLTLVFASLAAKGVTMPGMSSAMFVDVVLIAGLGYGIYRKSRVCAVFMLVYFIASKIMMVTATGNMGSIAGGIVFGILYFQAARATFAYHAFVRDQA